MGRAGLCNRRRGPRIHHKTLPLYPLPSSSLHHLATTTGRGVESNMPATPPFFPSNMFLRYPTALLVETLVKAATFLVFAFLDLLDLVLCFFYRVADAVFEKNSIPCYCWNSASGGREEEGVSKTLYERRNVFRPQTALLRRWWRMEGSVGKGKAKSPRWSDCCCEGCVSWVAKGVERLYFVKKEPSQAMHGRSKGSTAENPYFCSTKEKVSHDVLSRLAARRLWPPLMLCSSVMSWYEHLGRSVCFIFCRNHRKWEWILKLFTRRDLHFLIVDLTKHTHHSAWHTMHNVIFGAAKLVDLHLEALNRLAVPVKVIHGSKDQMVPLECSYGMKSKVPHLDLEVIPSTDHSTVVLGREKDFTRNLENFWLSSAKHS